MDHTADRLIRYTGGHSKALNLTLWTTQVLLALIFVAAGGMKLAKPVEGFAEMGADWATSVPPASIYFIGIAEVAGAAGLIFPALFRVAPKLTPLAAAGLALVMVLAMGMHVTRGELGGAAMNAMIGGIAAFAAWGRYVKQPIESR